MFLFNRYHYFLQTIKKPKLGAIFSKLSEYPSVSRPEQDLLDYCAPPNNVAKLTLQRPCGEMDIITAFEAVVPGSNPGGGTASI